MYGRTVGRTLVFVGWPAWPHLLEGGSRRKERKTLPWLSSTNLVVDEAVWLLGRVFTSRCLPRLAVTDGGEFSHGQASAPRQNPGAPPTLATAALATKPRQRSLFRAPPFYRSSLLALFFFVRAESSGPSLPHILARSRGRWRDTLVSSVSHSRTRARHTPTCSHQLLGRGRGRGRGHGGGDATRHLFVRLGPRSENASSRWISPMDPISTSAWVSP